MSKTAWIFPGQGALRSPEWEKIFMNRVRLPERS